MSFEINFPWSVSVIFEDGRFRWYLKMIGFGEIWRWLVHLKLDDVIKLSNQSVAKISYKPIVFQKNRGTRNLNTFHDLIENADLLLQFR